eukprot:TRINITY_DN4757_c0_g1_i1.p1 TRINITY_DN4757_c0_g1~~TRINITY_DN4757_c0_g1_i1.p1  ORF type:complete len:766 (-),score=181.57 TRINITY_DN4757_c0_g1_i1:36-2240(-)
MDPIGGMQSKMYDFKGMEMRPPPTAMNDKFQKKTAYGAPGRPPPTAMKSHMGTGYQKEPPQKLNAAPKLAEKNLTEEDKFKEREREVNKLVEDSASAKIKGQLSKALDLAKEAANKERNIRRLREQDGMIEQINFELTFSVCVNLANQFQLNGMYKEALNTYTLIVKNKNYPNSGRLRVNMGNIYFAQRNYPMAIKMYRMALDPVPQVNKDMRIKIIKNIGHAFIKLGEYQDAIDSYENIMDNEPDFQTGFNLIVCYYALGDKENMKRWFAKMLSIELPGGEEFEEEEMLAIDNKEEVKKTDPLKDYLKSERDKALAYISKASKLLSTEIDKDLTQGYDWVLETLKSATDYPTIESEIEMAKAIHYIKLKEFDKAIEVFKSFEKKDKVMMAMAANNISFLYFLERDYENAEKYAQIATEHDRYNARALVNKGNCYFLKSEFEQAKEHYLEAIGVEANCIEAIFNLGLVNKRMELWEDALQAFDKLQTIVPRNPEVMFQLGHIHEIVGNLKQAIKWYQILITRIPSDPGILLRIGTLYYKEGDELQALHFHQESYRYYPSNIETISWLGIYFAKSDLYEKAINFFERASQIQPQEVKWKLMVATCYRKMNSYKEALKLYEEINESHPDNLECLRYLVMICKDLGLKYDHYSMQLKKLERAQEPKPMGMGLGMEPTGMINPMGHDDQPMPAFDNLGPSEETAMPQPRAQRKIDPKAAEELEWGDDDIEILPQLQFK